MVRVMPLRRARSLFSLLTSLSIVACTEPPVTGDAGPLEGDAALVDGGAPDPRALTLCGSVGLGLVDAVALGADDRIAATGDGMLAAIDVERGDTLLRREGVRALGAAGRRVVAVRADGIEVIDVERVHSIAVPEGINSIAVVSRDASTALVEQRPSEGSWPLLVIDLDSGDERLRIPRLDAYSAPYGAAISADGAVIAYVESEPPVEVRIVRTADGAELGRFDGGGVVGLALAPDGSFVVVETIVEGDVHHLAVRELDGTERGAIALAAPARMFEVSPDARSLALVTGDAPRISASPSVSARWCSASRSRCPSRSWPSRSATTGRSRPPPSRARCRWSSSRAERCGRGSR